MKYKNYWGVNEFIQNDFIYTDNIPEIMDAQCKYLFQYTKGQIFAVFGEIKIDGSMLAIAKSMANIFKSVSGVNEWHETIAESSTKNLIDASDMYFDKRYGFEICTEKYRFRLFELRITPLYPVEIIIDEGICKNIENTLSSIAISMEKFNHFKIIDEETFCDVLKVILQNKKVRYIISELQKRAQDQDKEENYLPEKIIICEGQTDEIILQAVAQKLNQKVTIVVANGKYNVPAFFDSVKEKNTKSKILIVVDSDGDPELTQKSITEKIPDADYKLAIINNQIEDWFMPEIANFSKLKLMQSIDSILEKIDFSELCKNHESFAKVVGFLQDS